MNPYFDLYVAKSGSGVWSAMDARIPKARGGASVIVTFSDPQVTIDQLQRAFGEPVSVEPSVDPHARKPAEQIARFHAANKPAMAWILDTDGRAHTLVVTYGR